MLILCRKDERGVYVEAQVCQRVRADHRGNMQITDANGGTYEPWPGDYDVFTDHAFQVMAVQVNEDRSGTFKSIWPATGERPSRIGHPGGGTRG